LFIFKEKFKSKAESYQNILEALYEESKKMHRQAIYNRLIAECPSLTGGVHQPFLATADTSKPYGVIKMGPETPENRSGMKLDVQIFIYSEKSSFLTMDSLVEEVITALHDVEFETADSPPELMRLLWKFTTPDFDDEERRAVQRRIDFEFAGGY